MNESVQPSMTSPMLLSVGFKLTTMFSILTENYELKSTVSPKYRIAISFPKTKVNAVMNDMSVTCFFHMVVILIHYLKINSVILIGVLHHSFDNELLF